MRSLAIFVLSFSTMFAGSVKLVNDTSTRLFAVIKSGAGKDLGQVTVNPKQTMSWQGGTGYYNQSETPYTVVWYCDADQAPFSVCDGVSSGSTVTAMSCLAGPHACKPPKEKPAPPPSVTPQQQIQKDAQESAGPPQGLLE